MTQVQLNKDIKCKHVLRDDACCARKKDKKISLNSTVSNRALQV